MQTWKIRSRVITIILMGLLTIGTRVNAALHLELTQGVNSTIPVGLISFSNETNNVPGNTTLTDVIKNDLENSGEFRVKMPDALRTSSTTDFSYWRKQGVNALITGEVTAASSDTYQVKFQLVNLYGQAQSASEKTMPEEIILNQSFTVKQPGLRQLAHHISDLIYQKLIGVRGIFSTKIAYVLAQLGADQSPLYYLEIADADGFNPQTLLRSRESIMSPTWTPDGSAIAYVSFEGHHASIYLHQLDSGERQLISSFPGINGAPAFSPDGKKLALVLTKTGNPKIYALDLRSKALTQITDGYAIDTEPVWSADGRTLYFTSNRAGGPQIYQYDFGSRQTTRVSFDGDYNARACLTPQGDAMVMIHREMGLFGIAKMDLLTGRATVLTESGADDSPSLAPNGKMVLYGTQFAGRSVLGVVSIDGSVKLRLPALEGSVQDPSWSPYIN